MEIFLLRHGMAEERDPAKFKNDAARPLIAKGKKQLRHVSAALKKMDLNFDLILSSPFLRAKETADLIATDLKLKKHRKFSDALTPEKNLQTILSELKKTKPLPKRVLLVGHEPFLSRLISLLTTGDLKLRIDFKKGGLAKLKVENLATGQRGTLVWLLTPKQLKLMA